MRRFGLVGLFAVLLLVMGMATPVAAQYVTPPGQGPTAGGSDTGGAQFTSHSRSHGTGHSASNGGGGVEVLGVKFVRGANGEAIALTGAGIIVLTLFGLALVVAGVVVWRRSHDGLGDASTA